MKTTTIQNGKTIISRDCFSDDTKPNGCENWKVHETKEIPSNTALILFPN